MRTINISNIKEEQLSHDELLDALYDLHDAMRIAGISYFIDGKTLESVMNDEPLRGKSIHIGVREPHWSESGINVLKVMYPTMQIFEKKAAYRYHKVKVKIRVYKTHPVIENTDMRPYYYEYFNVPNSYSTFLEVQQLLL